jgi:hypothetical protein
MFDVGNAMHTIRVVEGGYKLRVRQLTTASIETIHGLGVGYFASCLFTKGLSAYGSSELLQGLRGDISRLTASNANVRVVTIQEDQ